MIEQERQILAGIASLHPVLDNAVDEVDQLYGELVERLKLDSVGRHSP